MAVDENEMSIVPGNRRAIQKRRSRKRETFGPRKKETFLEALACTCNVMAAAEAAGVAVTTVYNHRRKDPEFRALWWIALEQGAAKLVALRLQKELERVEGARAVAEAAGGFSTALEANGEGGTGGRLEVALDGPPDARQIADLYKLIGLLKEHSRGLAGEPKQRGRAPEKASVDEVCKALAKRLKAFGLGDGTVQGVLAGEPR